MKRHLKPRTPVAALAAAAVTAMLAVAMVGVASASAAPTFTKFGVCSEASKDFTPTFTKENIWYYNDNTSGTCGTHVTPTAAFALGTGAFGLSPSYSERVSTGPVPKLTTVGKRTVECETEQDIGENINSTTIRTIVHFTGKCHAVTPIGSAECHSVISLTAAAGTINSVVLKGKPVYLGAGEKASEGVGIALEPESGTKNAEFDCESFFVKEKIVVKGSIVCPVTPINTPTKTFTLTCAQTGGVQEHKTYYEGGKAVTDHLETEGTGSETFGPEESAQEVTSSITAEEEGEIKA